MLVLIDESGCCGFNLNNGSSPFFVLAMIIFADCKEAENVSKKIADLRKVLKIKEEFKFSKAHPDVKEEFFSAVIDHDFSVRALVVDKSKITSSYLKKSNDNFYNYFLKTLIEYDSGVLENATIKIDGRGTKIFQKALKSYIRKHVGSNKIRKIKFTDSKKDNLIQLADMVVGAVAKTTNHIAKDKNKWLQVLQNAGKISNIWNFK